MTRWYWGRVKGISFNSATAALYLRGLATAFHRDSLSPLPVQSASTQISSSCKNIIHYSNLQSLHLLALHLATEARPLEAGSNYRRENALRARQLACYEQLGPSSVSFSSPEIVLLRADQVLWLNRSKNSGVKTTRCNSLRFLFGKQNSRVRFMYFLSSVSSLEGQITGRRGDAAKLRARLASWCQGPAPHPDALLKAISRGRKIASPMSGNLKPISASLCVARMRSF